MNYPVTQTNSRLLPVLVVRIGIILLLIFFTGFFIVEAFTFIRLFEVTMVANPAINIIK